MSFSVFEKKLVGSFGFEALCIASRTKRVSQNLRKVFCVSYHNSQFNTAARNKTRTVQSFYNQSAIDIAAAKVNI